jgi:putative DNA primase/helicase
MKRKSLKDVTERRGDEPEVILSPDEPMDSPSYAAPMGDPDWRDKLSKTHGGMIKANLSNVALALTHAPEWAGVLAWDEFGGSIALRRDPPFSRQPGAWGDTDDNRAAVWLQDNGLDVSPNVVAQAVAVVSEGNRFHPVREWLNSLRWDATPRLDAWLTRYFGVADDALTREVARRFLIGAVARIFRPGCKNDHALILEGPQGSGKSTAISILFSPWYTDEVADIGSRDAAMGLRGVWGVELGELDALSKKESTAIKAWLTRQVDRYRPPYGRREIEAPRQCVFLGSTNKDDYLRDSTGNRRFWTIRTNPVRDGRFDLNGLKAVRDQLWAEAVCRFRAGEAWHITDAQLADEMRAAQEERREEDPWEARVLAYVADKKWTTIDAIADQLGLAAVHQDKRTAMRIADILRFNGWAKRHRRREEGLGRIYPWERA